jgi:predicted RNase H-like nuclease (RuvC/YqgF family)
MVEVLFLLLGGTLAFVYMQYEQKKDLENRVKTLESDYISLCTQINQTERNVYDTLKEEVHSLKADMWQHLHAHEVDIRDKKIKEILKD